MGKPANEDGEVYITFQIVVSHFSNGIESERTPHLHWLLGGKTQM